MEPSSQRALALRANAKVNLCLAVHYPPQDGYHRADSVFQEIDLHDIVRVELLDSRAEGEELVTELGTHVGLACFVDGLDPRDNLVFRALDAAEQACGGTLAPAGASVHVSVEKHIPAGGGLGGGSSDAAAMLRAYARLTGLDPLDERLIAVAQSLGADVAFFLYGGCALMRGRGDAFERALPALRLPIVLMGDDEGMSTAAIYRAFDDDPIRPSDASVLAAALEAAPEAASQEHAARLCANNLDPVACAQSRRLQTRIDAARSHPDALNALVSGSGSTSFAICADEAAAERFAADMAPLCAWVRVCTSMGNRPQESAASPFDA